MEIEVAGEKAWAWTYIYNGTMDDAVVLASGDWRTANS